MQSFWQTPHTALDESCMQQSQPEDRKWCLDVAYVLKNHVTTPFFISQDLNDAVWWQWLHTWNPTLNEFQLAQIVHDQLLDLGAPGIESRTFTPGIFGPNCSAHEFLPSSHFFDIAMGTETFHTTLYHWLNHQEPSVVVQPDTDARPPYARSDGCP